LFGGAHGLGDRRSLDRPDPARLLSARAPVRGFREAARHHPARARRPPAQARFARRAYEYRLTPKGLDLQPVLLALVRWGDTHMAGEGGRPVLLEHRDCGQVFDPVVVCSHCGGPVDAHNVRTRPGPGARVDADSPADRAQAK
jgi:hypothetical protein